MLLQQAQAIYQHVQRASQLGLRLIPVHAPMGRRGDCTCGYLDCRKTGKHPEWTRWTDEDIAGRSDSFMNEILMKRYAFNWNLGVLTGRISGVTVLDLDGAEGIASFQQFEQRYGTVPDTFRVKTARGLHIYVQYVEIKNSAGLMPGLDIRSDGGMAVFAGSQHASGVLYEIERDVDIASLTPVQIAGLHELMSSRKTTRPVRVVNSQPISQDPGAELSSVWREGVRHHLALALGGVMARGRVDKMLTLDLVMQLCQLCQDDELEDRLRAVEDAYHQFETDPSRAPGKGYLARLVGDEIVPVVEALIRQMCRARLDITVQRAQYGERETLTRTEQLVYDCLDSVWDETTRTSRVCQEDIADAIGKNIRTVQRAVASLAKAGHIWISYRYDGRRDKRNYSAYYLRGRWMPSQDLELVKKTSLVKPGKSPISTITIQRLDDVVPGFARYMSRQPARRFKDRIAKALIPCIQRFIRLRRVRGLKDVEPGYIGWALEHLDRFLHTYQNLAGEAAGLFENREPQIEACLAKGKTSYGQDRASLRDFRRPDKVFGRPVSWILKNFNSISHYLRWMIKRERCDRVRQEARQQLQYYEALANPSRFRRLIRQHVISWITKGKLTKGWKRLKSLTYFMLYGSVSWYRQDGDLVVRLQGQDIDQLFRYPGEIEDSLVQGSALLHGDGGVTYVSTTG